MRAKPPLRLQKTLGLRSILHSFKRELGPKPSRGGPRTEVPLLHKRVEIQRGTPQTHRLGVLVAENLLKI